MEQGSRFVRANFLLWFSSSFIWVAVFYLALTLLSIQIGKPMFMPIFISVFAINYFLLQSVYIKSKRSELVVERRKGATKSYVVFARFFVFLSIFASMAIMLSMIVYYGKSIGFL